MTRSGVLAALVGTALVAAGWQLGWPALTVCGAVLVALCAAALNVLVRRPQLRIHRTVVPGRVAKGDVAVAHLEVTNRAPYSCPPVLAIQRFGNQPIASVLPRLGRSQSTVRTCRLPTSRRGRFLLGPVEITREDPFGLVHVSRTQGDEQVVQVTPTIVDLDAAASGVVRNLDGYERATAQHGTIVFHRIREYVTGDDLRTVHWRSTARTGQLMVRHNIDVPQPHTVVVLDVAPQRYPDDQFELAVDVAASVAVTSAKGHAPVQLRPTVGRTVGRPGRSSIDTIIDELTIIEALSGGSLHRCLERVRLEANGTTLVIVTGQLHHLDIPAVVACRKRFNRVVVVNVGPVGARSVPLVGIRTIPAPDLASFADAWARTMGR